MPLKPAPLILATYLCMLILAPALGAGAGYLLDSQARACMLLGAAAMLLGYLASLLSWYGGKFPRLFPAVVRLTRGTPLRANELPPEDQSENATAMPASILFIPICGLTCAAFGLAIAYFSRALFVNSFFCMAGLGAAYGWALHRCAAAGLLIAPEEIE